MSKVTLHGWGRAVEHEQATCGDCGRKESVWQDEQGRDHIETFTAFWDGKRYCDDCRDRWPDRYTPPEST